MIKKSQFVTLEAITQVETTKPKPIICARTARVVALVPAYNEEVGIHDTLTSLMHQTHPVETILVICDNCTDGTVEIVTKMKKQFPGCIDFIETVDNKFKKAGALNQAVIELLELDIQNWDIILQMDADTTLDRQLVEQAVLEFAENGKLGGICSRCGLQPLKTGAGFFEKFFYTGQLLEYNFGHSKIIGKKGTPKVLAGAVTLYRTQTILDVLRENKLRDKSDQIWEEDLLVEDYGLTLTVKDLGWQIAAGVGMFAYTDAMLTLKQFFSQRIRWYRGSIDLLRKREAALKQSKYRNKRGNIEPSVTAKEIYPQFFLLVMNSVRFLYLVQLFFTLINFSGWNIWGILFLLIPVFALIRYMYRYKKYVPKQARNRFSFLMVALVFPYELYCAFDDFILICSYAKSFLEWKKETTW